MPLIQTLLNSKALWCFSYNEDPYVRRATYNLIRSSLGTGIDAIDWKILSATIIGKSLSMPQLGSASDLSDTLLQLTQTRPQIWTSDYNGKPSSSKRLRQYVQKGSQGGSEAYWSNLLQVLQMVPFELLAKYDGKGDGDAKFNYSQAGSLIDDFLEGLSSRDEPRQNLKAAWSAYIDIGIWLAASLDLDDKDKFVQEKLTPIFDQYVTRSQDESRWVLPKQHAESICASAFVRLTEHGYVGQLRLVWTKITSSLIQAVKISSPEQSKGFQSSQDAVSEEARRVFGLEAAILSKASQKDNGTDIATIFREENLHLLESCLQVLQARDGKPYGAAAMLEEAIRNVPHLVETSDGFIESLKKHIPRLLFTPSAERIMSIVLLCRDWHGFDSVFQGSLQQITETDLSDSNIPALQKLLSSADFKEMSDFAPLISILSRSLENALKGKRSRWSLVLSVAQNTTIPDETLDRIVLTLVEALSSEDRLLEALFGLSQIATRSPGTLRRLRQGANGSKLIAKLLYLTESPVDEISQAAESLEIKMRDTVSKDLSSASNLEILEQSFDLVGPESLS